MKRYIRASFNNNIPSWFKKDKGLLRALSNKGIDLANLTLTQDKAKRGSTGSQYTVYRLINDYGNESIYIPGIHGDDDYITDPYDRKFKAIKYVSKKNLPIKETWYINIADNQKPSRERYHDPRYEYSRYESRGRYAGQHYYIPSRVHDPDAPNSDFIGYRPGTYKDGEWKPPLGGRDKSGYVIPVPSERLMEFFNSEKGLKSLGNRVQDVYEDLIDVQENIFRTDFTTFGKDSNGNPDVNSSAYRNMINEFGDAVNHYKRALRYLKSAQDSYESGYASYDIREAFDYIKSIKKDIKHIRKILETENDW